MNKKLLSNLLCALTFQLDRMTSAPPRHVIWQSAGLVAYLHPRPWTPGSVILEHSTSGALGGSIFQLDKQEFLSWLLGARAVAELLCDRLAVRRCALVSRPHRDRPAQVRCSLTCGLTGWPQSTTSAQKKCFSRAFTSSNILC